MAIREALLGRGRELEWFPSHMRARYENWVNGLNGDWCVSRQRFFGVPFPVWYRVTADGTTDYESRLVPAESRLPIDPSTAVVDPFYEETTLDLRCDVIEPSDGTARRLAEAAKALNRSPDAVDEDVWAARYATAKEAPDFTLQTLDDTSFTLSSLRGKVVLLNFWFPT